MDVSANEFQLIQTFFNQRKSLHNPNFTQLSIGDDCALVQSDKPLAISVDTSIANVHFPDTAPADVIAARALNVALSDLAAMGAKPVAFTLALQLPKSFETYPQSEKSAFLESFSLGLFEAADYAKVDLIGGDTTACNGPLSISVSVYGVQENKALKRSGAQVGDTIYLSRPIGDAGAGLKLYFDEAVGTGCKNRNLLEAYLNPLPESRLGQVLSGFAHAAIDVSDGLISDLKHILAASSLGANVDFAKIPVSEEAVEFYGDKAGAQFAALSSGDDYALCFTADKEKIKALLETELAGKELFEIGYITESLGLDVVNCPKEFQNKLNHNNGYDHFDKG